MSWWTVCKALRSFETCVLVNNNLCRKLFSSLELPTIFKEIFKITLVPFFIPNFTFKVLYWVILYWHYIEQNKIVEHIHNTFTAPCEKSKMVSFASSIMKSIVAPSAQSRFPAKLIFCIAFGSASGACYLLKSITIIL